MRRKEFTKHRRERHSERSRKTKLLNEGTTKGDKAKKILLQKIHAGKRSENRKRGECLRGGATERIPDRRSSRLPDSPKREKWGPKRGEGGKPASWARREQERTFLKKRQGFMVESVFNSPMRVDPREKAASNHLEKRANAINRRAFQPETGRKKGVGEKRGLPAKKRKKVAWTAKESGKTCYFPKYHAWRYRTATKNVWQWNERQKGLQKGE